MTKTKGMLAALALTALAGPAAAQTWTCQDDGSFTVCRARMTSATAVASLPVKGNAVGVATYISGTATSISASLIYTDRLNVPLTAETLNVTSSGNQVSRTVARPFYFTRLRVSPTAGLTAANEISITVIQPSGE